MIVLIRKLSDLVDVDDGFLHYGEIMVLEEHNPGQNLVVEYHPEQADVEHSF
jgi:hypothetical protein